MITLSKHPFRACTSNIPIQTPLHLLFDSSQSVVNSSWECQHLSLVGTVRDQMGFCTI